MQVISPVTLRDRVPITPIPRADRVFDHLFIDCMGPLISGEGQRVKYNCTGEPPLQLRRLQLQLQYAVKVKALKDHPASKVFQQHWMNRTRKYNDNTDPIYNKVFTFLDKINISECETVFPTLDPPWRRKKM